MGKALAQTQDSTRIWQRVQFFFIALLFALSSHSVSACTQDQVLEVVARLESGGDYNTVWNGVRLSPPRPITSMSVGDVLIWQRATVRAGSASSAAGRYQVIRPTLQSMVDKGVVSPTETYDATVQDRIGRHLLRQTGYRDGDTSAATANRIAGVWAALPKVSGPGAGSSAYEGIAGNHAGITAESWRGVLECKLSANDIGYEAAVIRAGTRFGIAWDDIVHDMAASVGRVADRLATAGLSLMLVLLVADLVLRAGRWIFAGSITTTFSDVAFRIVAITITSLILFIPEQIITWLAQTATGLASLSGGEASVFSFEHFANSKIRMIFSLYEGVMSYPTAVIAFVFGVTLIVVVIIGLQMALILWVYAQMFLAGAAAVIVAGFGGLQEGKPHARNYAILLLGSALSLLALMLVLSVTQDLAWDVRSVSNGPTSALIFLLMETLSLILIMVLPPSIQSLAKG